MEKIEHHHIEYYHEKICTMFVMNDSGFMKNIVQIHSHSLSKQLITDIAYELLHSH